MFEINKTVLVVIDVQGKLATLVAEKEKVYANISGLIKAVQILNIPIIYTEQVPEKIGKTIPKIALLLSTLSPITKSSFSCCGSKEFLEQLTRLKRKQVIITGIETHVCVYQTITDLLKLQFAVQVVADAVSSRTAENRRIALERVKKLGADITSTEMVLCELLKTAKHEKFRDIIKFIK